MPGRLKNMYILGMNSSSKSERFWGLLGPLILFALIVCNKFIPIINGNQEQYLGLPKQFINTNWIVNGFSLSEFPGTRIVYDYLIGNLLSFYDFKLVADATSIINMFFLAFPLYRLVKHFGMKGPSGFMWWQLVLLSTIGFGAFFGGEWFLGEAEAKTFAYIGILWGLCFYFEGHLLKSSVAFALGAIFHPLAAGWPFAVVVLHELIRTKKIVPVIKMSLIFLVINAPLLVYYAPRMLIHAPSEFAGVSSSWIYTFYRVPHHTAPFKSWDFFMAKFLPGALKLIAFFIFFSLIKKRIKTPTTQQLISFIQTGCVFILTMLLFSYFKISANFLKFFLFRFNVILQLLCFVGIYCVVKEFYGEKLLQYKKYLLPLLLTLSTYSLGRAIYKNQVLLPAKFAAQQAKLDDLFGFAKSTPQGAVFMNYDIKDDSPDGVYDSFIRNTERDLFVNFKFLPADGIKLVEWYRRIQMSKKLQRREHSWKEFLAKEKVDYVLSAQEIPELKKVFTSKTKINVYQTR